jgi:hypothetical protein
MTKAVIKKYSRKWLYEDFKNMEQYLEEQKSISIPCPRCNGEHTPTEAKTEPTDDRSYRCPVTGESIVRVIKSYSEGMEIHVDEHAFTKQPSWKEQENKGEEDG